MPFKKGNIPWIKNLDKNDPRIIAKNKKQSETMKKKYASGKITSWNKGLTKETNEKLKLISEKIAIKAKERFSIPENNTRYIDGRSFKKGRCIICGEETCNLKHILCQHHANLLKYTPELKKKCSERLIKRWSDPEARKKQSKLMRKYFKDHPEVIKKMSEIGLKNWDNEERVEKARLRMTGPNNFLFGKKRPEISKRYTGKGNPVYIHGLAYEPYPPEWNKIFRNQIRYRDEYKCQICGRSRIENGRILCVHHIDYNKKNLNIENLITLCHKCHAKTNINRPYWINYFNSKQLKTIEEIEKEKI